MTNSIASAPFQYTPRRFEFRTWLVASALILLGAVISFAQISAPQADTFVVEDVPDQLVICYGKTVIVRTSAKGVVAIGGDVIVEGRVTEDVAAIGGSVIQKENAYIGGDVFAVGGVYKPESSKPMREEGRETIMLAGYEKEIRDLSQNPSSVFSPQLSVTFLAQRILSVLFWFVVSLVFATLAPGAVSRAIARFQLSTLKVLALGVVALLATTIGVFGSLKVLPNPFGMILGLMTFVLLMLAYVFGRIALNVSVGKLVQKYFWGEGKGSEALAILIGVVAWTLMLSIPYVWTIALFVLFSSGIGLVLTAGSQRKWQVR